MEFRTPWDPTPEAPALPPAPPSRPKRLGRRPATTQAASAAAASPWLYHHLTISGPDAVVTSFAEAARGSGIVPWRVDGARLEEDIFNLAASQPGAIRSLTIDGCRILARQFRERVEDRAARAAARVGRSCACPGRACPFDLHTLLPVPAAVLDLGPSHPDAQSWLAKHWGITDTPRQVTERHGAKAGRRLPAGHTVVGYSFFTAGETPHAAIAQLGSRWPTLRFVLRLRPLD
jgi:hypothetical protein